MKLSWLFNSVVFAALGTGSAIAQSPNTLQVTVPFAFTLNKVAMPAGDYSVIPVNTTGNRVLALRNRESRHSVLFVANPAQLGEVPDRASLVFGRVGDDYYLENVWWAGSAEGVQLLAPEKVAERATTAGLQPSEVTIIAAR